MPVSYLDLLDKILSYQFVIAHVWCGCMHHDGTIFNAFLFLVLFLYMIIKGFYNYSITTEM